MDGVPVVKLLEDVPIGTIVTDATTEPVTTSPGIEYIDNGTTGAIIDPTELLFVGGKEIIAGTMADKDNTLFLGDITEKNSTVLEVQKYFRSHKPTKTFTADKTVELDPVTGVYGNTHQLSKYNQEELTTFKGNENYRFGFQLQKVTGEWSEPIWIGDATNTLYPNHSENNVNNVSLVTASADINISPFDGSGDYAIPNFSDVYKKIRPVIVFPTIGDRKVLCQGVLNPTVFNVQDRKTNSPFAQASWYFRPYMKHTADSSSVAYMDVEINGAAQTGIVTANVSLLTYTPNENVTNINLYPNNQYINTRLTEVHVLVGEVENSATVSALLSTKYLTDNNMLYPFIGAICLDSATNKYAFISNSVWSEGVTYSGITSYKVSPAGNRPKIYNNLQVNGENLLYYSQPDDIPSTVFPSREVYYFCFYVGAHTEGSAIIADFYSVLFEAAKLWTSSSTSVIYKPVVKTDTVSLGNSTPFTHFDSLINDSNIQNFNTARRVEIQGSFESYEHFYDTTEKGNSNTQFFVDQSIVTLNSPDIEFDTQVQVYGSSNLKLRVVGAIPITANASAHHVTIKSNTVEMGHNLTSTTDSKGSYKFGSGELNANILYNNPHNSAGNRLIADYLWNDVVIEEYPKGEDGDKIKTGSLSNFLIYPWHRSGSLNNDYRSADKASSLLNIKRESNILFSGYTSYFRQIKTSNPVTYKGDYTDIDVQFPLTENAEVMNYRLAQQSVNSPSINYYPNIDKVLYNGDSYKARINTTGVTMLDLSSPISMKYLSTSHAIIGLKGSSDTNIPILPYGKSSSSITSWGQFIVAEAKTPYWITGTNPLPTFNYSQDYIEFDDDYNFLWLGEIYKEPSNPFGGDSDEAIRNNKWVIAGEAQLLSDATQIVVNEGEEDEETQEIITLKWDVGDTYYQRYDCLKTYAMTNEDTNQIVEILSFMCETRINIDGRYDRNRGQIDNTRMRPQIFNLLNDAYTQTDNYFTYQQVNEDKKEDFSYPNQIYYTKTKNSGADVDLWTNVTLGSVLEMDGDKGRVTSLQRFNDQILAFQDTGISQILYNENMQISTTEGVPIEIANSGKVTGKRYISDTIGCSNKWSIVNTPSGIYFMDDHDKSIYLFNGQLANLSTAKGFNSWCKQNFAPQETIWCPSYKKQVIIDDTPTYQDAGFENFVGYYDKLNQDVLWINKETALAYSEKVGNFTSFYDYGNTPFFCNFKDMGLWINSVDESEISTPLWHTKIHEHQGGDYCKFFGVNKPYWMTLVGNPDAQIDKIFTNLEFRASVEGDGELSQSTGKFTPTLPFDSLESWNEYQHGIAQLGNRGGHDAFLHHLNNTTGAGASLKRKFRIWRCDIPRDNYEFQTMPVKEQGETDSHYNARVAAYLLWLKSENEKGIFRHYRKPNDRMRNPWIYMKLLKTAAGSSSVLPRAEIHDIIVDYFV